MPQLPPDRGPEALSSALASERELLTVAVAELLAADGFVGLRPERIAAAAKLPSSSFAVHFGSPEEALEATQDFVFARYRTRLLEACGAQSEWPLKVKVGIGASLDFAAAAPAQAQLISLDSLGVPPTIARRALDAKDHLAGLLQGVRRVSERGAELPSLTEQTIIAALCGTVSARLFKGEAKRLPDLAPQLVELTLIPYLGQGEASRVARRPRPLSDAI